MTVLGALARPGPSNAIQVTPWGDWTGAQPSWSGSDVTPISSVQLVTVYGCVRFISDGISTLPIDAHQDADGAKIEVAKPDWLEQPTTDLDYTAWAGQMLTSLLLAGDAFCLRVMRGSTVRELIPLDPTRVEVFRKGPRKWYRVNGVEVDPFLILHIPGLMYPGSDRGLSPVEAARQSIGLGMSAQEFGARFFGQGTALSGVIEVPGELAPDKAGEMARSWSKRHGGKDKSGLPGVLQGGATWKPIQLSNEQSQFLETRRFTAAEIASQMFLIDPPEIGIGVEGQSLTYSNLEQRNIRKVQVTFLPWIVRLEKALSSQMPPGRYVKINVNGLLRGDMKTRFEAYRIGDEAGFVQNAEIRAWEDLPPMPEEAPAPPALVDQIEAVGQLIRAGFEPAAALEVVGLPPIAHTGLVPVTVKSEDDPSPGGADDRS